MTTIQIESYRTVKELLESAAQKKTLSPNMMKRIPATNWRDYNNLLISFLNDIYVNGWIEDENTYYEIEEYTYQDILRFFECHADGRVDEYFNSCTILAEYQ